MRLVGANGEMLGIMPTEEALARAREAQMDLVEVSPNADPPVCKLLDYGKFKYEQKKRDHEAKRKQRGGDFKELRFRPKTDKHDLEIKLNQARRFLEGGDRVRVTLMYRGREMQHISSAEAILQDFVKKLEDVAKVEQSIVREGRRVFIGLMPKPGVKPKEKRPAEVGGAEKIGGAGRQEKQASGDAGGPSDAQVPPPQT